MPPSQLKKLKASLRESGVVGPQKSKKQQIQDSKNGAFKDRVSKVQKNAVLRSIREQFNPFEITPAGRSKHEVLTNRNVGGRAGKIIVARPGATRTLGEEKRRKTLLTEMQRRKKVGGIMDRRFGENDVTMAPEEKALQRFVAEKQRASKRGNIFDLEEDEEEDGDLTHFGKALSFGSPEVENDFSEVDLEAPDEDAVEFKDAVRPQKRRRLSDSEASEEGYLDTKNEGPAARHKTKNEVMKELISKSKLHKYERQRVKEDDDDLRAELDKGLPDLFALIRGDSAPAPALEATTAPYTKSLNGVMNPDRMAMLNGKARSQADREYDERLRQMAMDQRAKPTVPTLTKEEKAAEEAQRLKGLERRRLRRMNGEQDDSESESVAQRLESGEELIEGGHDDIFGLGSGLTGQAGMQELGVEDEDDFVIDDDLMSTESIDEASNDEDFELFNRHSDEIADEDAEFIHGLLLSKNNTDRVGLSASGANAVTPVKGPKTNLAFTYPCPQTHREFLEITDNILICDLPTVVQRIRALYQLQLASDNKVKLGVFVTVLVEHISYLANQSDHPPFPVLEALIRHIHSLAKTFPEEVGRIFRRHLKIMHESRPFAPIAGDLIILTAIGSIFPTSDHFHQVVTPAMLCMTRYLGQKIPSTLPDLTLGTYIVSLCLSYQDFSQRCIPEVINYTLNAIYALSPTKPKYSSQTFPLHNLSESLRIASKSIGSHIKNPRIDFWDGIPSVHLPSVEDQQRLKYAVLATQIKLVEVMADLWSEKSAFCEMLDPIYTFLHFLAGKDCVDILSENIQVQAQNVSEKIGVLMDKSLQARQPLRLHNHRPLAIKTSIPKFEESYNPDKHYDPDRDRADLSKLKAEHKKERKGALRELRKDANFMARENLKEKKEKDSAYEKKYKRLVAEIQGEEGREAKLYEKERKLRKGKK